MPHTYRMEKCLHLSASFFSMVSDKLSDFGPMLDLEPDSITFAPQTPSSMRVLSVFRKLTGIIYESVKMESSGYKLQI